MNCKKCGSPLGPSDVFCKECGTSVDVLVPGTPDVAPVATVPEASTVAEVQSAPATPVAPATPTPVVSEVSQPSATPAAPTAPVSPAPTTPVAPVQPVMQPTQMPTMQQPVGGMPVTPGVQPMGTAPVVGQPAPSNGKKTNKILMIVAVIAVIAAVAVVLYFTVLKKDDKPTNNSNSNNTQQNSGSNSSNQPSNSQSNVTTNSNSNNQVSGNTISNEGFTYQVPTGYVVQKNNLGALVFQKDDLLFGIMTLDGQYETVLAGMSTLKTTYEGNGYSDIVVKEQSVNGKSYIVITLVQGTQKMVIAYTKANANIVFGVEIYTSDNSYGTQYLETIDNILSTATFDSASRDTTTKDLNSIMS